VWVWVHLRVRRRMDPAVNRCVHVGACGCMWVHVGACGCMWVRACACVRVGACASCLHAWVWVCLWVRARGCVPVGVGVYGGVWGDEP
jgi:hypothetical protein